MVVKLKSRIHGYMMEIDLCTPFINAVLKMIEATYKESSFVELSNPTPNGNPERLSEFFEFILRYPDGVKTPKVIISDEYIAPKPIHTHIDLRDSSIVCFSGGIDSTAALLYLKEKGKKAVALWCDYGQPYAEPEGVAVKDICRRLSIQLFEAKIDLTAFIALDGGRFNHVFPARNLLFAAIAASMNPDDVIIAGLIDEMIVPDKSMRMYSEAPIFLGCKIYSPFIRMTKAEVLSVWKKRWNILMHVDITVSCYEKSGNCQNCSSCAKREVAKIASGYSETFPPVFHRQESLIRNHWLRRIDSFIAPRRNEVLIALNSFPDELSDELFAAIQSHYKRYFTDVEAWRLHLINIDDIAP